MTRKCKPNGSSDGHLDDELWINPRSNIRGPDGNRAWDDVGNITPASGARFLELADIALGLKKPAPKKKKAAATSAGSVSQPRIPKTEWH